MAYFIVQFPLKTEKYQEDILNKRFEIGRQIYNSLVNITQKRYTEMIKTKVYRNLISQLSGDKNKDKHYIGEGDVGIDIGISTVAYSSATDVKILELADKVKDIENQKRRLLRKMDRSRRATNSDNYNEDGTIKK